MLKQLSAVLFVTLLFACSNNDQDLKLPDEIKKDVTVKATPILFGEPLILDSSSIILYPLLLEKGKDRNIPSSSYDRNDRTSYWNVLFHNVETAKQHLLFTDKKMLISSVNVADPTITASTAAWLNGINIYKSNILYTIVSNDFDTNNQLDEDDPVYLYVSDREGMNFRQLSPDDYNIISWEAVKGTSKIIMMGTKDSDGNNKFDVNDNIIPLIVDLASMKPGAETFSNQYMDTLRQTMLNIWKPSK